MQRTDPAPSDDPLTRAIIGAFYYVHNTLGYGLLESVYVAALRHVLISRGHEVATEVRVPVYFERTVIAMQRPDMLVDRKIIVEVKVAEVLPKDACRQLMSYLNATGLAVGLLLHVAPDRARVNRRTNKRAFVESL